VGRRVVCGYGTNCSGVAPDGRVTRFPAIGPVSGDFGGGIELGTLSLWFAIRDEDGRGAPTALRAAIPAHFGMRRPSQVMQALYLGGLQMHRLTELTPLLFRAARRGDAVATDLVWRQADEIVSMATVAIRRLRLRALDVDVILGGGVSATAGRRSSNGSRPGSTRSPADARVRILDAPPVVGAAVIGLEQLGASIPSHRRLRAALTEDRMTAKTAARGRRGRAPAGKES
jgi:N-acetylglucosamine kinase-like BadF-type ATPase